MKIVTTAEMREIDRATSAQFGVPSLTLMENAGGGVAAFSVAHYPQARSVTIVCGKGNNGGDGFVIARKLHEAGRKVQVILLADPQDLQGDAAEMYKRMPGSATVVTSSEVLKGTAVQAALDGELLVDAVLGTGFRPPVSGLYAEAIAEINKRSMPTVSVDIPSGANSDAMTAQQGVIARSDAIVTFTAPRPAHVFGGLTQGPTVVVPIGSPEGAIISGLQLNVTTARDVAPLLAPRAPDAHKGTFGHAIIVGGSYGKAGAAAMAGMAALRSGAGLVTVATARSTLPMVAGFAPELMTEALAETDAGTISARAFEQGRLDGLVQDKQVIAIGPGLGLHLDTAELVRTAVERYRGPIVLDADGLNSFAGVTERLDGFQRSVIVTPHPGEMARLAGSSTAAVQSDRLDVARKFARDHRVTVVLKGHGTLVVEQDGTAWVNPTGNPGMATGGTGDILTGMIAGFVAQNLQHVAEAVRSAVFLHGLAGDVARETLGEQCLLATDLLTTLPEAMQRVRRDAREIALQISG
jgi:ADP-dependent NAD(P)H-hydrate dehydratase / NAD(P)H-hydrate epimerase